MSLPGPPRCFVLVSLLRFLFLLFLLRKCFDFVSVLSYRGGISPSTVFWAFYFSFLK